MNHLVSNAKTLIKGLIRLAGYELVRPSEVLRLTDPKKLFHDFHYLKHTARRLEHLTSLGLPVFGKNVLEVGAGIGDLTHYYTDRECRVLITEVRPDNLRYLRIRYANNASHNVCQLDLDDPKEVVGGPFDIVHCYGVLYHLSRPAPALEFLAHNCSGLLLLETCVSFGDECTVNPVPECMTSATQASSGTGCRPTRRWVFEELQKHFEYVYVPNTQPNDLEFPLDWEKPEAHPVKFSRAIFIGSRRPLSEEHYSTSLLARQTRHS